MIVSLLILTMMIDARVDEHRSCRWRWCVKALKLDARIPDEVDGVFSLVKPAGHQT